MTSNNYQEEIDRIRTECEFDERKLKEKCEEECKHAEENAKKEIESETQYKRNCLEIEFGKMRQQVEHKIDEINKNRYKNLGTCEEVKDTAEYKDLMEQKQQEIHKEIEKEQESFEKESQVRRARFEEQMKRLFEVKDNKRIEYLKKEVVPIVTAQGIHKIGDESIFDRYQISITRNALRTGPSWALYKSRFKDKSCVCRVMVLLRVPIEIRRELNNSAKCIRFLCEIKHHESFARLNDIFSTEEKLYTFMDEFAPNNMGHVIYRGKCSLVDINKWIIELARALSFMHNYAIGHLNIKCENIVFNDKSSVKIVGLSRAFLYFNLDQEAIVKAPKAKFAAYNDHLPNECFVEDFNPRLADVWSLGLLMYEMATRTNPLRGEDLAKRRKPISEVFVFSKVPNAGHRSFIEKMVDPCTAIRPKFEDLIESPYFSRSVKNDEY